MFLKILNMLGLSKLDKIVKNVTKAGFKVNDVDTVHDCMLIDLDGDFSCLLTKNKKTGTLILEASFFFDSSLINLKTLSDLNHLASTHKCSLSGIVPGTGKKIKLVLHVQPSGEDKYSLREGLKNMQKGLSFCVGYIQYRLEQQERTTLDLSMFEGIDITSFNPKDLGEKKEFVYLSWQDFMREAVESESLEAHEIQACFEFEQKNKMLLAEVGDHILDELFWYQHLLETSGGTGFDIN